MKARKPGHRTTSAAIHPSCRAEISVAPLDCGDRAALYIPIHRMTERGRMVEQKFVASVLPSGLSHWGHA